MRRRRHHRRDRRQADDRNRAEIPAEFRWDFSRHLPELGRLGSRDEGDGRARWTRSRRCKGTLAQTAPAQLLKAYQAFDEIGKLQYRLYRYPQLQRDVDTRDQAVAGRFQRVGALFAKFDTATAWFTPELLTMPEATMQRLDRRRRRRSRRIASRSSTPIAARRTCSTTRASGCSRSPASSTTRRATIYSELSTSDIKFPTVTLSDGKRASS